LFDSYGIPKGGEEKKEDVIRRVEYLRKDLRWIYGDADDAEVLTFSHSSFSPHINSLHRFQKGHSLIKQFVM
jgi:hypothetical protein